MRALTCVVVLLVVAGVAAQADTVTVTPATWVPVGVFERPDLWPPGLTTATNARYIPIWQECPEGRFRWVPMWAPDYVQTQAGTPVELTATVRYEVVSQAAEEAADWSGFGTLEGVAAKPLAPTTLDLGAGVGLQLTTLPAGWLAVGGRKVFANALLLTTGDLAWGGSISLQSAAQDDGFRLGVCWNSEDGVQAFLGKSFSFAW